MANTQLIFVEAPTLPQTVYCRDEQPSGTVGGNNSAAGNNTRTLNTLDNPFNVTWVSLSGNEFTLDPGIYNIEASAPAYKVSTHKLSVMNDTTSLLEIIGSSAFNDIVTEAVTRSEAAGTLTVTVQTPYSLTHYTTAASGGTQGLGVPTTISLVNEVYAMIKITKVG